MRCGYSDDLDQKELAMWRGRVMNSIRGKRGQSLLRDCLTALDAMPVKRLVRELLVDGADVCLLGAGGMHRGISDIDKIDHVDHDTLAERFNVTSCLIKEIEFVNDEAGPYGHRETPEERFVRVRKWVEENINTAKVA